MNVLLKEVEGMIKQRREEGSSSENSEGILYVMLNNYFSLSRTDLLGRLLASVDPETGETISDQQLRDELITILIAGHETTAAMLGFVFYILSQYPEVEKKVIYSYS
jgi:cytochrome P450